MILLLLAMLSSVRADSTTLSYDTTYAIEGTGLNSDNLQNAYVVSDNKLYKIDRSGKLLYTYEENRYGEIGTVDAFNALKTMVYYPNYLTIVMLDKTLSFITAIDLFSFDYEQVSAVSLAKDNNFWMYDQVNRRLLKINESGEIMLRSDDLAMILDDIITPTFILEQGNKVFVCDPELGVYIFDLYANYEKRYDLVGIKEFQVIGNKLFYIKENQLFAYNMLSFELQTIPIDSPENIVEVHAVKDTLFVLREKRLDIYTIRNKE